MGSEPDERPLPVAPPLRGEHGFADWCIRLIEAGHCTCDDCGGHLESDVCLSCGCRQYVQEARRFTGGRHPVWIPVYEDGRCSAADKHRAE